mmetsp:Transcript_33132/g.79296  ORF Transcript_33132/g.79296 Transcript_33132/m.79296 type:complete len:219 (-) Transcript_33132:443-1099(-)
MQWPRDWLVLSCRGPSLGVARMVFSHHSRKPSAGSSVLTSSCSALPSRSSTSSCSAGSRPSLKVFSASSKASFTFSGVSPTAGSNSTKDADVHSSPLFAMAAQQVPCATAGWVTETPSKRTLFKPLTSPACSMRRLPSSMALTTRLLNMAEEPVNCSRSTCFKAACKTSGSASGVMPGSTSTRPSGKPHAAKPSWTSRKWGKNRGCTMSSTRKPLRSM